MKTDRCDWIQAAVIARAKELGLTAVDIARATVGKVSDDHVRAYLTRSKSMGSHKLQHVLRALGLTVTAHTNGALSAAVERMPVGNLDGRRGAVPGRLRGATAPRRS